MDLRKKGLYFTLKKGMDLEPFLHKDYVARGSFSKSRGIFEFPSGRYEVGMETGSGTYGDVYLATSENDGSACVIKVMDIMKLSKSQQNEKEFVRSGILQAVSNIILEEESANEPEGPFVPKFYEIVYDSQRELILLRTERVNDTLYFRYIASTSKENDKIIPRTVSHLAHILDFFQKRLEFNHRDLKPNNVMYNYLPNGEFQIKLIDFGWVCMNYYGTRIKVREYFDDKDKCNVPSRDLSFFLYCIQDWCRKSLSLTMVKAIEELLTFNVDNRTCRLYMSCYAYGESVYNRDSAYDFLNIPKIKNPNTIPKVLRSRMMEMLGIHDSKQQTPIQSILSSRILGLPYCPPTRILNPKTRKCVRRDSEVGKSIIRKSKKLFLTSPRSKTRKQSNKKKSRGNKH